MPERRYRIGVDRCARSALKFCPGRAWRLHSAQLMRYMVGGLSDLRQSPPVPPMIPNWDGVVVRASRGHLPDGNLVTQVSLNELGFRDAAHWRHKQSAQFEILLLGDSIKWGYGVEEGSFVFGFAPGRSFRSSASTQ